MEQQQSFEEINSSEQPILINSKSRLPKWVYVLATVFFVIMTTILVVVLYQDHILKKELQQAIEDSRIPTPQQTISPIQSANPEWKTYRNETYGFEFQYPSEFSITQETPHETRFSYTHYTGETLNDPALIIRDTRTIDISQLPHCLPYPETLQSIPEQGCVSNYPFLDGKPAVYSFSPGPVNGEISHIAFNDGSVIKYVRVLHIYTTPYNSLEFEMNVSGGLSDPFDQILSTFRFVEKNDQTYCETDTDCGLNYCQGCKAMNTACISDQDKMCLIACTTEPFCKNNTCVAKQRETMEYQNEVLYNSKEECERTELQGCECMVTDIETEMCTGWRPK